MLCPYLQAKYEDANLLLPQPELLANNPGHAAQLIPPAIIEQFVSAPLPRNQALPLVDDWNCLRVRHA